MDIAIAIGILVVGYVPIVFRKKLGIRPAPIYIHIIAALGLSFGILFLFLGFSYDGITRDDFFGIIFLPGIVYAAYNIRFRSPSWQPKDKKELPPPNIEDKAKYKL